MRLELSLYGAYGSVLYRPECELSRLFCDLLKQKSLTSRDVALLKRIGFVVLMKGELV